MEARALELSRYRSEDVSGALWLEAGCVSVGQDLVVIVGGGQRPHVGAAALAVSSPDINDPSVTTQSSCLASVPGHKEADLARDAALRLSKALNRTVVVTVGIHDDAISKARIMLYLGLFDQLIDAVIVGHQRASDRG
jgi:gallate decarboxylase subunit D